jgi:hypothetical protein
MNLNHQIFSGVFADEIGQRFLTMLGHATENAYCDLCESCGFSESSGGPGQERRLRECLTKVPGWDKSVITGEIQKITKQFHDYTVLFKQIYINYVKSMRGGNNVKIMINLPKFEDVFHSYLKNVANHKFMKEGNYFKSGPLEQKCISMECIRDALYNHIGDEYVKIENKNRAESNVFAKAAPIKEEEEAGVHSDCEDSIVPEDSVSQFGYSARRERDRYSDRSSDVSRSKKETDSLSLSSVTLSQTERTRNRNEDGLSNAKLSVTTDTRRRDKLSDTGRSSVRYDSRRDERSDTRRDDRSEHRRDERFDNRRDERFDNRRDERFDDRSETYKSGTHRDARSDTYQRFETNRDNRSEARSYSSNMQKNRAYESEDEKSEKENNSSEDSSDDDHDDHDSPVKKRSPCRSYVTQLTEDSRMTNE